jgi:hypothetical protein
MIKYKIIEVNQAEHSIVVRYYTDTVTEESLATDVLDGVIRRARTDYSIDLPIPTPTGADLEAIIMAVAPTKWLTERELLADTSNPVSMDDLVALVGVETACEPPAPIAPDAAVADQALTAKIQGVVAEMLAAAAP